MNSKTRDSDWFVHTQGTRFERLEAYFGGHAFNPHRHDTYAIGLTLSGVQSFHYRGALRSSTPGHTIVVHPDELHDGHAGSASGFRYRMLYVPPTLIQDILGGQPLPFVPGGIVRDAALGRAVGRLLRHVQAPFEGFEEDDALFDLTRALCRYGPHPPTPRHIDYPAAERARDYLDTAADRGVTLAELEGVSGQNRWRLSRDFRLLYGTSPYRYLTMRRLAHARRQLERGVRPAAAAFEAGFADQSHMTRQFSDAFGITPGRWAALIAARRREAQHS
ncbi:AraC family transcriptional regulator [Salinisphaera sp. T31B1]|uniref:AraC family transcriptional regulator n=1 Tax=Salinisphaera sp. T31B1 TaxID=727963 RepID=UPI00333F05E6